MEFVCQVKHHFDARTVATRRPSTAVDDGCIGSVHAIDGPDGWAWTENCLFARILGVRNSVIRLAAMMCCHRTYTVLPRNASDGTAP